MSELEPYIEALGAWGYLGLGLAAFIEYLFPPFPGDTVVLLGGAWAEREGQSLVLALLAVTLGSMAGIAVSWRLGRSLAGALHSAPEGSRLFGLQVGTIRKAQALMRGRGAWLLLANRFLPSFRTVLFVAAGAAEVSLPRTLLLGTVSSVVFNAVLLGVGQVVGDNAEAIKQFFGTFRTASLAVVGLLVLLLVARFFFRRARAQSRS